jgi:hypothetical protein
MIEAYYDCGQAHNCPHLCRLKYYRLSCRRDSIASAFHEGSTMRYAAIVLLLTLPLAGCKSTSPVLPRYIVSSAPLALLGERHPGVCVAVDPSDEKGVWWWEPGRSGCSSRSTGPTAFLASHATVARSSFGPIDVSFQIQLIMAGAREVKLTLRDGAMLEERTGLRVPTERKASIEVPEMPPD